MRQVYILAIGVFLIFIGIVAGFYFSGYLTSDQEIIPPESYINWEQYEDNSSISNKNNTTEDDQSDSTNQEFPLMLSLTETMSDIPGIENINYEVFVSNDSIHQIFDYYEGLLKKEGYAYHEEYSSIGFYESSEIYYYTFIKGLNAVIFYLSEYDQKTWVCYSTGSVLQYQDIYNYMLDHDIIT